MKISKRQLGEAIIEVFKSAQQDFDEGLQDEISLHMMISEKNGALFIAHKFGIGIKSAENSEEWVLDENTLND